MADKCPHQGDEASNFPHWNQTALIATHESYLNMIGELKQELDSLSDQVAKVQQDFHLSSEPDDEPHTSFEASLKVLESQNDLLKKALLQATLDKQQTTSAEENSESLKGQIEHLHCIIVEKEECIAQLNSVLQRIKCEAQKHGEYCNTGDETEMEYHEMYAELARANAKIKGLTCELERSRKQERFLQSETRKLNEELVENKRRSGDVAMQATRLAQLLNAQESLRAELSRKYEGIESNYEEQSKNLHAACTQLSCLQDRLAMMDKRHEEHIMERNLLRDEVLALKEKEACLMGKHRSISDQMLKIQKELFTAHDVMNEQKVIMQRNDYAHNEIVKRLQENCNELKFKLNGACEDFKRLESECRSQIEVRKQNEQIIESFRKWKEAQLKSDDATRASFRQYEEHIRLLLEEKQKFVEQYRDLHRDYCVLQHELDRLKTYSPSLSRVNTSENSMSHRMELLRRTSRRINQQSNCIPRENPASENTSQDAC